MKKLVSAFCLFFFCSLSVSMLQACISDRKETPVPSTVTQYGGTPCPNRVCQ